MKSCLALHDIATLVGIVIFMCICMMGCTDVPYSVFKVNDTDSPSNENSWTHDIGEVCYSDGFDYWCPVVGEVVVEVEVDDDEVLVEPEIVYVAVPVYVEVEVEGATKHVEVPGETRTVEVVKEVEVEVEKIIEVVKEVEVEVEKIVEVVKIVEKEVEVEVIKEVEVGVEVEVIKEVEKIIEIPIEKIVYRDVPGTTLRVPFTGKISIPDCGYGNNCMAVIENGIFVRLEYDPPEPLVVVCQRSVDEVPSNGWVIIVYYPTEQLGQDALATRNAGFSISTSEGVPIFEQWSSGGDEPVCAHYWLSTDATSIEVTVSARFNNILYNYQGTCE